MFFSHLSPSFRGARSANREWGPQVKLVGPVALRFTVPRHGAKLPSDALQVRTAAKLRLQQARQQPMPPPDFLF